MMALMNWLMLLIYCILWGETLPSLGNHHQTPSCGAFLWQYLFCWNVRLQEIQQRSELNELRAQQAAVQQTLSSKLDTLEAAQGKLIW